MDRINTVCLIGSKINTSDEIKKICQVRGWTLLAFNNATEALACPNNNSNSSVIYVLQDFEGTDFQALLKSDKSVNRCERKNIFSPEIMKNHLKEIEELCEERCPRNGNVQGTVVGTIGKFYNLKLRGKKICISGVRSREDTQEWNRLVGLIRFMGGEDVKKVEVGTNFLISKTRKAEGDKYRRAVDYDIPILTCEWLDHVWDQRNNPDLVPSAPEILARFRIKPFEGLKLAFVNYNEKDLKEMSQFTTANGGEVVEPLNHNCTHIIVDSVPGDKNSIQFDFDSLRNPLSPSTIHQHILYQEWFWLSIELGGCIDEKRSDLVYPVQGSKNNPGPKASSLSEFRGGRASIQSPQIDISFSSFLSPNMSNTTYTQVDTPIKFTPVKYDPRTATKRHINCMELYMTEGNYVEILRKMVHEIQKPLEEKKYLDTAEMKIIFGTLPALLECHENIYKDLDLLIGKNWAEENKIGEVFVKHGQSMFRCYSNFVNSFEFSKEMIDKCQEKCQQFRAFLMIARNKCDRQSLQDLFIAPVQRIPRYLLLLKDIQKNTDPSNPDSTCIKAGISRVEQVLTQINEDKRKTEGHVMMLDVVNEIEGGAHLLSSRRHYVDKIDVKLLLNENGTPTPWKGHPLTLLLFDDVLEICKKRAIKKSDSVTSRNSSKSSSYKSSSSGKKPYKHIEMVKISDIVKVFEIDDDDEYDKMVFIQTSEMTVDKTAFKVFPFQLRTPDNSFLNKLKCYSINEKENDFKDDVFKNVPTSFASDIDFSYAEYLASTVTKSSLGKARAKLSRTFSMSRRQSVSTTNLAVPGNSNGNNHQTTSNRNSLLTTDTTSYSTTNFNQGFNLPKAPSTTPRRSSSRFSNFMSPLTNTISQSISSLGTPLSHFNRQISISSLAINKLSEKDENARDSTDAFSLPSTPAPRKKKCAPAPPQVYVTPAYSSPFPSPLK